jgi:hypothetical protein
VREKREDKKMKEREAAREKREKERNPDPVF